MGDSTGRIIAALQLAAEKHRDQRRKDLEASPYINHPIALASVLWAEGGVRDAAVICAALLHDTIEDTQTTREELRRRDFGVRQLGLIRVGDAFQLRDDLLGVYGDAEVTGKPVGDDLREGKLTPLVAVAAARADEAGARLLGMLGRPDLTGDDVRQLQQFLVESGARDEIERAIERLVDQALVALGAAPITSDARIALEELGTFVAWRDR